MQNTKINKLEKSKVEITSSIQSEDFNTYEEKALERLIKNIELPGFRKGHVPKDVAKKEVNDMMLLEEMALLAINDAYPKIIETEKIDAIGNPEISITKIARGSDLEFKIVTAVLPELKLPDYKKIAKEENQKEEYKEKIEISDQDVEKTIENILKSRATKNEAGEEVIPELNEEFIKSLGKFENVEDFKIKLRENMKTEKEMMRKDKCKLQIVENIIKETNVEIPEILVESEANKLLYRMEADITNMGLKFDDYLSQIKKTREELKKDWEGEAEKRAKLEMILYKISEQENLKPTEEEITKEVEKITNIYKDADPIRARAYVEQVLTNEKVFAFLENQK